MKFYLRLLCLGALLSIGQAGHAQTCATGYSRAQLNWDYLDYVYNSGTGVPYNSYVTDAMEMNQKFAIGRDWLTIATSSNAMVTTTENTTHTGELSGYTGADVQYTSSSNGQYINITFNNEAQDVSFSLYDVDDDMILTLSATNAAGTALSPTFTNKGSNITLNGTSTAPNIDANGTAVNNASNNNSVTVTVAGPVKSIRITVNNRGSDPSFWLSDINACIGGSFPVNYQQVAANKPFTGQPDYVIATPDNNSAYMIDPATGQATHLFTEAGATYINSFAYDPVNRLLYYVLDYTSSPAGNKALKRYDFTTGTSSTVVSDVVTGLGIPTFNQGVESAGACFYDGALYLGIEGGRGSTSSTRESMVWKIQFNSSLAAVNASQVFALPAYDPSTGSSIHDWGDFSVKDGILYDFNTARNGSSPYDYSKSAFHHFNMLTGSMTTYNNPSSSNPYVGQSAVDWNGNLFSIRNVVELYNLNGTLGSAVAITTVGSGPAWVGNAGDAAEGFRPKVDFGDAPATYDPSGSDPAVHATSTTLRLGATNDLEWEKNGATTLADADGADEDGLPYAQIFNPDYIDYLTELTVFNNTGAAATVCAWIDADGSGTFEASEGITVNVNSSASTQNVWLYWPSLSSSLAKGSYTYMRIRIASSGLSTSTPTGYLSTGEVEDYRVPVDDYPMSFSGYKLDARLSPDATVRLNWNLLNESAIASFLIERSADGRSWAPVKGLVTGAAGSYRLTDAAPLPNVSYYRLRVLHKNGRSEWSAARRIDRPRSGLQLQLAPNPARDAATLQLNAAGELNNVQVEVFNAQGARVHGAVASFRSRQATLRLPVEGLASGRYLVRVTANGITATESLLINK